MSTTGDVLGGRYRLEQLLGRGGMSDVYRAVDEVTGTYVTVKIVRSSDLHYGERLAQEARALERFEHPGLARLLDVGMTGDMAFLVMEYIDGTSLAERLRRGPLSAAQSADLGAALCAALNYIHQLGVVHRDVKPANILIDQAGQPRLTDFGIARLSDATTMTLMGTTLGTASYMAPEQLENHQVGPAADIWSLGMVLDECLTGRRFYEGTPSEVIARRLAGTTPDTRWLPSTWRFLLAGMLDHDPAKRLSALDVASIIVAPAFRVDVDPAAYASDDTAVTQVGGVTPSREPIDGSTSIIATPLARGPNPPALARWRQRHYWWAPIVLALVLLGSGLAYGLSSDSSPTTVPSTTTSSTTTSTTTTTTTVPSGSATSRALTLILSDLANAEASGTIDVATAQPIGDLAQQAVADSANANPDLAASDLQQAAALVVNGVGGGSITQGEGTLLDRDLNALATALGLTSSSTTTSQPSTPGPGPGPGNGNGHGHGNSN